MAGGALGKAASGVAYLIGFQFISRVATFVLNLFIVRNVAPEVFGIGNVHLQLFMNIVFLLSREGFRRAITRCELPPNTTKKNINTAQSLVRIIWCVIPVGILVSSIVWGLSLRWRSAEELEMKQYETFMFLTFIAVIIEIFSEPFWIMMQMLFLIKQRVGIEAVAVVLRCLIVFFGVFFTNAGLLSFVFGQLAYSLALLFGFFYYFLNHINKPKDTEGSIPFTSIRDVFPTIPTMKIPQGETKSNIMLVFTFSWQSLEKLLLQESEKIVLKFTNTLLNQGVFSVVSNLGSLVLRFLFQPVEEISFTLFSKLLGDSAQESKIRNQNLLLSSQVLLVITKLMLLIGLVFICFGMNYSAALLELLYGEKYGRSSSAPTVLSYYCISVACMAVNGITESFFSAAASTKFLRYHNIAMIGFSGIYICSCIVLVRQFETPGLVLANCVNMMARILFSLYFIKRFLYANPVEGIAPLRSVAPSIPVLFSFIGSFFITWASENYFYLTSLFSLKYFLIHSAIGTLCLLVTCLTIYFTEKTFIANLKSLRQTKQKVQ